MPHQSCIVHAALLATACEHLHFSMLTKLSKIQKNLWRIQVHVQHAYICIAINAFNRVFSQTVCYATLIFRHFLIDYIFHAG